jgi:hypothetical protein
MDLPIDKHLATKSHLAGMVKLSVAEAKTHPEYPSEAAEMSWGMKAETIHLHRVSLKLIA